MRWFMYLAFLGLVSFALFGSTSLLADPDVAREGNHRPKLLGSAAPAVDMLYINDHGFWSIGPGQAAGQATYLWRGDNTARHTDLLTFLGRASLTDQANGRIHHGWVYQAVQGNGPAAYWFFANTPLETRTSGPIYSLFYSQENVPVELATFHRYLTNSGTQRW